MGANWQYKKITDVCSVLTDGNWIESKDQSSEGIRLIQTGNIGNGVFKDKGDKVRFISEDTFNRLSCTEIFEGDVLVSRLPEPIGRSCILPKLEQRTITAVDCSILRFKKELLNKFFVYFTLSPAYDRALKNYITGSSRKRISRSNLGLIKVPVPSIEEQQRIVDELDLLIGIIDKKNQQLRDLDSLVRVLFIETFCGQKNWPQYKLGDICETTSGGTPSKSHPEYYSGGNIPWLRSGEVEGTSITDTEIKITELGVANSSAKWFPKDTVVVAMYGATVGEVGILGKTMTTNQAICGIFPCNQLRPLYLYSWFRNKKDEFVKQATGGAQPNISQGIIRNSQIDCPTLDIQDGFAEKIAAIESQKQLIRQSIVDTTALLNSRIDYYFNE